MKINAPKNADSRFKKKLLRKQPSKESKIVNKDSMNILLEFELLSGENLASLKNSTERNSSKTFTESI